jgi:hypothetical protein
MPLYLVFSLFDSSNCPGYKKAGKATFIPNRVYALTGFMDSHPFPFLPTRPVYPLLPSLGFAESIRRDMAISSYIKVTGKPASCIVPTLCVGMPKLTLQRLHCERTSNKIQIETRTLERPRTHSNAERWNDDRFCNHFIHCWT